MYKEKERVTARNVTLYETDLAILRQAGKDHGIATVSASLRFIIRDWTKMKAQQQQTLQYS